MSNVGSPRGAEFHLRGKVFESTFENVDESVNSEKFAQTLPAN